LPGPNPNGPDSKKQHLSPLSHKMNSLKLVLNESIIALQYTYITTV
jgi:hypothetical protein